MYWRDNTFIHFGNPGYHSNPNAVTWREGTEPAQSFSYSTGGFKYQTFKLRNVTSHKVIDYTVNMSCSRRAKNVSWSMTSSSISFSAILESGGDQGSPCFQGSVVLQYI